MGDIETKGESFIIPPSIIILRNDSILGQFPVNVTVRPTDNMYHHAIAEQVQTYMRKYYPKCHECYYMVHGRIYYLVIWGDNGEFCSTEFDEEAARLHDPEEDSEEE